MYMGLHYVSLNFKEVTMPYIPLKYRKEIDLGRIPDSPGELNYQITTTILDYLGGEGAVVIYSDFNEVLGVLEAVKLELYRRMIAPYEDIKKEENGDVY